MYVCTDFYFNLLLAFHVLITLAPEQGAVKCVGEVLPGVLLC